MTPGGIRATAKGKPSNPASVDKYLQGKFGEHLAAAEKAMAELTRSYPQGVEGWGAEDQLGLSAIHGAGRQ